LTKNSYVVLSFGFHKEGQQWLGECIELGTATFGNELKEARERLEEAVLLHLDTLEEVGERERFFKEHGIKLYRNKSCIRSFTIKSSIKNEFIHPHIQQIPVPAGA